MNRLRKFVRLDPSERALILGTTCLVVAVRLGLWLLPFRMVTGILQVHRLRADSRSRFSPARLAWAIRAVSRSIPGATCLSQALALHYLLTRAGHISRVQIGVTRDPASGFKAHAWVEHDDGTLLNTAREVEHYSRLHTVEASSR